MMIDEGQQMSSIDEISRSIGKLEAGVHSVSKQMDAHSRVHQENNTKLTTKIDELATSMATLVSEVHATKADVEELQPDVASLKAVKNQMVGIVALFSVGATFLFSWINQSIK